MDADDLPDDQTGTYFDERAWNYDAFDRARLSMLRRAVRDADLCPAGKLVLFVLARNADLFSHTVSSTYRELEDETGLGSGALARGISSLRKRSYIKVAPGRPSTYRLLPLRVVSGREGS